MAEVHIASSVKKKASLVREDLGNHTMQLQREEPMDAEWLSEDEHNG
jgi:hypothetical protein